MSQFAQKHDITHNDQFRQFIRKKNYLEFSYSKSSHRLLIGFTSALYLCHNVKEKNKNAQHF